jgi:hypothetical protein
MRTFFSKPLNIIVLVTCLIVATCYSLLIYGQLQIRQNRRVVNNKIVNKSPALGSAFQTTVVPMTQVNQEDTILEIEKCKAAASNPDESQVLQNTANQINAYEKVHGALSNDDAQKWIDAAIKDYKNQIYEDCLNRIQKI